MRIQCQQCGSAIQVPAGVAEVVCEQCGEEIDIVAEAQTLQTQPLEAEFEDVDATAPTEPDAPTISTPRTRFNCPNCHKELTVPADDVPAECPDCGAALGGGQTVLTEDFEGATAKTAAAPPRPGERRKERKQEKALEWMRRHFSDRYEILEFVGSGGMGAVFRARQKRPSRQVAMKVMRGGQFASGKQVKRFEREAQAVAMLQHPAIVPVFDYGEVAGQPYFTMEYVEGRDLRTYVEEEELSRQQICRMVVRVCDAVHYAHRHGVIHRDLKPANILVDKLNRPRILDFGLSRVQGTEEEEFSILTMTGDFLGTPRYMSPEQALRQPSQIDERTDVFALGVVLYELIVGVLPYPVEQARGLQFVEVLTSGEPLRPSALRADMSRDLELILLKAVAREKQERYQTAEALAEDLENWLADRPINARAATAGYRLRKWAWRNRRVLTPSLIGAAVVLVLSTVFGWQLYGRIQELRRKEEQIAGLSRKERFYVRGAKTAMEAVVSAIEEQDWRSADRIARNAPTMWPGEPGIADLPIRVRYMCERFVRGEIAALREHLLRQRYDRARRAAERLGTLATGVPFEQMRAELENASANLDEFAWQELLAAVDRAYTRKELVSLIEGFQKGLPENPHRGEAESLLKQLASRPEEHFLQRHRQAFERAMREAHWDLAEQVLESGRQLARGVGQEAGDQWLHTFQRLAAGLGRVIRPRTLPELRVRRRVDVGRGPVRSLQFSGSGHALALGPQNGPLQVIQVDSGDRLLNYELDYGEGGEFRVMSVTLSRDGELLVAGLDDGRLLVLSVATGELLHELSGHEGWVYETDLTPDAQILMSADREQVLFWEPRAGQRLGFFQTNGRRPAGLSHDGSLLAVTRVRDEKATVILQAIPEGPVLQTLAAGSVPFLLAFSPDDSRLVTAHPEPGPRKVKLWDVWEGEPIREWAVGQGPEKVATKHQWALAFSPDGRMLATGDVDEKLKLWEVPSGRKLAELRCPANPRSAVFSPDGRLLVAGLNNGAVIWGVGPPAEETGSAR